MNEVKATGFSLFVESVVFTENSFCIITGEKPVELYPYYLSAKTMYVYLWLSLSLHSIIVK